MNWSVRPEPADENEREALLAALERALAEEEVAASGQVSVWWRSGFGQLGGDPAAQEPWGEPRIVEP